MYIIDCKTLEEAKEVARFYNWDSLGADEKAFRSKGNHAISMIDNKPWGWGRTSWYLNKRETPEGSNYCPEYVLTFKEWEESVSKPKENNMKYVVEVNNQEEAKAVDKHLGQSDYKHIQKYPWGINAVNGYLGEVDFYKRNADKYGPVLPFRDWALMFGVELKPNKTLKLTSDYSAEVNYNTKVVQVGCQSIPFSKVEELAELIKE